MKQKYGLREVMVPERSKFGIDETRSGVLQFPQANIFMSEEFYTPQESNREKNALVLIQGTGNVRAGQWARSVCINDDLEKGSMLPQIDWALNQKKYPVIVMNPNYNRDPETNKPVPLNSTMAQHAIHVWKHYIRNANFKSLLIIAHSAGGFCLEKIQVKDPQFFYETVKKIAITDSMVINRVLLTK